MLLLVLAGERAVLIVRRSSLRMERGLVVGGEAACCCCCCWCRLSVGVGGGGFCLALSVQSTSEVELPNSPAAADTGDG